MAVIGYLMRVEFKRHLGSAPEGSKTCFVVPPADCKLGYSEAAEKAFSVVAEALHEISRFPIMEEVLQRRVSIGDLRPLRNSLVLEKDGWRCFSVLMG